MLIGILSDTHGLLRQEVIDGFEGVDHITRLTWDFNKTALYELNCRLLEAIQIGGLEG